MRHALGVILLFVVGSAQAIPVVWTLQDVAFDDGGTATGSYVYDADSNAYSDINVTSTAGTAYTGESYTYVTGPRYAETFLLTPYSPSSDLTGETTLVIFLADSMTNVGGTVQIRGGGEAICGSSNCSGGPILRDFASGSVSAVPIPAAVGLFGSALAGLGFIKRRSQA